MVRILGVNIPDNKRVPIALSYIYGVGRVTGFKICQDLKIDVMRRASTLSEDDVLMIRDHITNHYTVEGDLKTLVISNVRALIDQGCYRGIRHRKALPVRGQRTRSNARTAKKKIHLRSK